MRKAKALTDSATDEFYRVWSRVGRSMAEKERAWRERLIADGVCAAHPDDGWVDRERNLVRFVYPHFSRGVKPGDRIALGYGYDRTYRLVEAVEWVPDRLQFKPGSGRWHFREIGTYDNGWDDG